MKLTKREKRFQLKKEKPDKVHTSGVIHVVPDKPITPETEFTGWTKEDWDAWKVGRTNSVSISG